MEPAIAAIEFALKTDEGLEFLRCWVHGDFETITSEWPDAPKDVFTEADSHLKTTEALDAARFFEGYIGEMARTYRWGNYPINL